jgi:hypothetical protein
MGFLGMVRLVALAPFCLSFEEKTVRVGNKVLMEVDDNILLNVADPQGIIEKQLMPHPTSILLFY